MEELKAKVSELCELKDTLLLSAREEVAKGICQVNTHEMGEVIDMIKDLAEAEEKFWKACYYKKIVEAMEEDKEAEEMMAKMGMAGMVGDDARSRMGYDNWRYASGRFAPTGHGHKSGYRPGESMDKPWMMAEGFGDMHSEGPDGYRNSNDRMGYTGSHRGDRYAKWSQARMGYHNTKNASEKQHMDASAREYVVDTAEAMREIWKDADPSLRKEIKSKLVALTGEMN